MAVWNKASGNVKGHGGYHGFSEGERNYFNVHEAKDSLWDRLLLHLLDVFDPFSMKLQNNCSQLLDKLLAK